MVGVASILVSDIGSEELKVPLDRFGSRLADSGKIIFMRDKINGQVVEMSNQDGSSHVVL